MNTSIASINLHVRKAQAESEDKIELAKSMRKKRTRTRRTSMNTQDAGSSSSIAPPRNTCCSDDKSSAAENSNKDSHTDYVNDHKYSNKKRRLRYLITGQLSQYACNNNNNIRSFSTNPHTDIRTEACTTKNEHENNANNNIDVFKNHDQVIRSCQSLPLEPNCRTSASATSHCNGSININTKNIHERYVSHEVLVKEDTNDGHTITTNNEINQNSNLVSPDHDRLNFNATHKVATTSTSTSGVIISQDDSNCECESDKNTNIVKNTNGPSRDMDIAIDLDPYFQSNSFYPSHTTCNRDFHTSETIQVDHTNTIASNKYGRSKLKQQSKLPWISSTINYTKTAKTKDQHYSNHPQLYDSTQSLFHKVTSNTRGTGPHSNSSSSPYSTLSNTNSNQNNSRVPMLTNHDSSSNIDSHSYSSYLQVPSVANASTTPAHDIQSEMILFCHVCQRPSTTNNNINNNYMNNMYNDQMTANNDKYTSISNNFLKQRQSYSQQHTKAQSKKQTNSLYDYFNAKRLNDDIVNATMTMNDIDTKATTPSNNPNDTTSCRNKNPSKSSKIANHTTTNDIGNANAADFINCSYCDHPTCCLSCTADCDSCSKTFCKFCYTVNYDWVVDRCFCPDCNDYNIASYTTTSSNSNGCSDLMYKMDIS